MLHSIERWIAVAGLAGLIIAGAPARAALDDALGFERTPPRLSYVDGEVSFFRPGTEYWEPASLNTPLAAGDELHAAEAANLEIQIGARAYLRAGEETQLELSSVEPDFLQIFVAEGDVSLDLRSVKASQTFQIDTPDAAFTIEHSGYYRVEVAGDSTRLVTRRGGRASVTHASGTSSAVVASEQVVISGAEAWQLETDAAPGLDAWDRWNYARTQAQLDAASARYVPAGVYGVDDLDRHGSWRVVPRYGAIWVPRGVAAGWAPYSAGRWIHDPYYGWSWVDAAPWGWAPYHYGRWVHVSDYWGWAPGPVVVRPRYAPALVAFFGGGGLSVGFSIGAPHVGWVALGWGEPIVPWWGPRGVRGVPRWAGWGGPRVVNRVVVKRETVIHVKDIHRYQHTHRRNAFVAVDRKHFGRRGLADRRIRAARVEKYAPLRGELELRPDREHRLASRRAEQRSLRKRHERPTVTARKRHERPTVTTRKRHERPTVTTRKQHERPTVTTRKRHERPTVTARKRHERPTVTARKRHERPTVTARKSRVAPVSKREEAREKPGSKRSQQERARKKRSDGERATSQEPPRRRSERSREAGRRKERPAPAAPQLRPRKPESRHTQLARGEAPEPQARRSPRGAVDERRGARDRAPKPARVRSGKKDSAGSNSSELPREPERRVSRKRGRPIQPKAEKAPEPRRKLKTSLEARRQRGRGRRS